jgi:hypothetical protein
MKWLKKREKKLEYETWKEDRRKRMKDLENEEWIKK